MRSIFARLDEKHNCVGNFEKFLKIFDENSMEKLYFSIFCENLLLKIETSEITSLFYNNFFRFGGFKPPTPLPAYATVLESTNYLKSEKCECITAVYTGCRAGVPEDFLGVMYYIGEINTGILPSLGGECLRFLGIWRGVWGLYKSLH